MIKNIYIQYLRIFGAFHAIFRNEKRVFRQVLWKIVRHFSGMLWLGLFSQDKNVIVILACGEFL